MLFKHIPHKNANQKILIDFWMLTMPPHFKACGFIRHRDMEKTPLEKSLENELGARGMPFSEREYFEEIEFGARIDTLLNDKKDSNRQTLYQTLINELIYFRRTAKRGAVLLEYGIYAEDNLPDNFAKIKNSNSRINEIIRRKLYSNEDVIVSIDTGNRYERFCPIILFEKDKRGRKNAEVYTEKQEAEPFLSQLEKIEEMLIDNQFDEWKLLKEIAKFIEQCKKH